MPPNLKNKIEFAVMSYNKKLENFLNLQTYKQSKSQKRATLGLYCIVQSVV